MNPFVKQRIDIEIESRILRQDWFRWIEAVEAACAEGGAPVRMQPRFIGEGLAYAWRPLAPAYDEWVRSGGGAGPGFDAWLETPMPVKVAWQDTLHKAMFICERLAPSDLIRSPAYVAWRDSRVGPNP